MMALVKLVLIAVLLLTNVFCQEMDIDNWREGIEEVGLITSISVSENFIERMGKIFFHTSVEKSELI